MVDVRINGTGVTVNAGGGPLGPPGVAGTLTNNSGVVTTVPTTGFGHRITTPSNGRAFQIFGSDENHFELMYFGGGGERRTRKFDIVSGVTSDNDTSPAGIAARQLTTYRSVIHPSSKQPAMGSYWSDVDGPTIQVRQSYAPSVAMSFVSRLGKENFIICGNDFGEQRWHVPGSEPVVDDYITAAGTVDGAGALTAASAAIRLRSYYSVAGHGLLLYDSTAGSAGGTGGGAAGLILGPNGAIYGMGTGADGDGVPNGTPRNVIQIEIGTTVRIGNSTNGTVINGGTVAFEKPPKLPAYTVAGVPSAATHTDGQIIVTNEAGGRVVAFSDTTNWRRVTDRAIIS